MEDFLFRRSLEELDPAMAQLIEYEAARQARKLVMVPSESLSPPAVHEAMSSEFSHIYAEGYPDEATRTMSEEEILDYEYMLGHFRRYSDPRYYKGVEYADVLEALARRRIAEAFAANGVAPDGLYVNVQPLSGAPANTAVQHALMDPGDTLMSLALHVGGHLTHGSKVAYSGKTYDVVHYGVDDETERLDFDAIRALALEHRPRLIIAGYTSYPLAVDWQAFRKIADEVGAYLLADIAHTAGMVAAGALESPVGIADVVTFTTHKSLDGPRGAVILTHNSRLRRSFDRAVFPGLQGGPHMEVIAGIAVAAKLAQTETFRELQRQTVRNAQALAKALEENGIRVAYGGTDTHMVLIDCKTIEGPHGTPLMGDPAANLLDLAGIVANRNTIPGDTTAAYPSGVRFGTPWITQRGMKEPEMQRIAENIARLLQATEPYETMWRRRKGYMARVDFDVLEGVKVDVRELAKAFPPHVEEAPGYPHLFYIDDEPRGDGAYERLALVGEFAKPFVHWLTPSDTVGMADGESRAITLLESDGEVMAAGLLTREDDEHYTLDVPRESAARVMTWLRELSDGFAETDDVYGRLYFLKALRDVGEAPEPAQAPAVDEGPYDKFYFVGAGSRTEPAGDPLPRFEWQEPEDAPLRETRLHDTHVELGARMVPFGGWEMPVWYSGNLEEHNAVRKAAGLFDVSHMGCWDVTGPEAADFLNVVLVNDVNMLEVGESQYTAFFDVDGVPIDDLLIYRLEPHRYLIVVNAANNDKDWAWVNAVLNAEVQIDRKRPWVQWPGGGAHVHLRDLRDPAAGEDQRHELALQGPKAKEILLALGGSAEELAKVKGLPWSGVTRVTLGDFDLIVSRTGYTGERIAYEIFVHPDRIVELWNRLSELGEPHGLQPAGLAARDSLRLEAGLPLYGHEMAGPLGLTMGDAGFGTYAKTYKPFFVGRGPYIERELQREAEVIRFRVPEKGHRRPDQLDRVVDDRGRVVGFVTSIAIDSEGYLMGQAFVDERYTKEGTELGVLITPRRKPKPQEELELGDRTQLPVPIEVLSKFPKRK
ncbi:MAG: glycine cleavage system aminomethyltransferase GcvT [Anaerolineales bacterium]